MTPVWIRFKTVGIKVGGHIAGQSRIGVFPPGTTNIVFFLVDNKIFNTRFSQTNTHADPRHARADHNHPGRALTLLL